MSDSEALAGVKELTDSINDDRAFMVHALAHSADFLVGRWKKKSITKRTQFLLDLRSQTPFEELSKATTDEDCLGVRLHERRWGAIDLVDEHSRDVDNGMSLSDRMKFAASADEMRDVYLNWVIDRTLDFEGERLQALEYLTTWLLPYLDIESLAADPMLLLKLLHNRTVYSPEDWMMFDNTQLRLCEHWEILIPEYNEHCVTMSGPKYGAELVQWTPSKAHRWHILGYNKAKHILAAQRSMMHFLRATVQALLSERESPAVNTAVEAHNPHAPPPDQRKWNLLVNTGFTSFGKDPSAVYSVRGAANQPFAAPPVFDAVGTLELVESLYRAAQDELELAQTDPAFLQLAVREISAGAFSKRMDSKSRWDWLMDEVVCNYYRRFVWWRQMFKECEVMVASYKKYQARPCKETRKVFETDLYVMHNISLEHEVQQMGWIAYR